MPPTPAGSPFGVGCDERGAGARATTSTAQRSRSHATRTIVSEGGLWQLGDSENLRLQTRAARDGADRTVDPA